MGMGINDGLGKTIEIWGKWGKPGYFFFGGKDFLGMAVDITTKAS